MHARAQESSMIVGSGQFKYRVIAEWAKLPDGWSFKEVGGVGVDRHDNVYASGSKRCSLHKANSPAFP
jgi:hypothetical protein